MSNDQPNELTNPSEAQPDAPHPWYRDPKTGAPSVVEAQPATETEGPVTVSAVGDFKRENDAPRTVAKDRMLQFFAFAHLPLHLAEISAPFADLAEHIVDTLPSNPERAVALRKLLEAKDCAVRARLFTD